MAHQVDDANVKDFFWQHMKKDLLLACKSLNLTLDEIYILLHKISNAFVLFARRNLCITY
jgi:hypothetical protein